MTSAVTGVGAAVPPDPHENDTSATSVFTGIRMESNQITTDKEAISTSSAITGVNLGEAGQRDGVENYQHVLPSLPNQPHASPAKDIPNAVWSPPTSPQSKSCIPGPTGPDPPPQPTGPGPSGLSGPGPPQ
eukprot:6778506-Ditylum_brightwellii.AAC.1